MEHAAIQVLLLLLVGCLVALVARRFRVPYTLALVVAGIMLGTVRVEELEVFHLTGEVLFTFLLPALLFEAAFHLDLEDFRRSAPSVLTLAIGGVLVSAAVTGGVLTVVTGAAGMALPIGVLVLFAVVIAATDPISVLALFRTLGVPRKLYTLVEGESLLNDGVAVVLFIVVAGVVGAEVGHGATVTAHGSSEILLHGARTFLAMAGGGVIVGAAVGALMSGLMRQFDDHLVEVTLTTVVAYGSFLLAEALGSSGVLSTVTAGVVTGSFGAKYGMSTRTRLAVEDFWEYAAFVANTLVFLLMGLILHLEDLVADGWLVAAAFVATLMGRAVAVYGAWPLLRAAGQDLPTSWSHVLAWGGLRGSLSMVLVLGIAPSFEGRETLIHMVFGTVSASLFLQGLTMSRVLAALGLSRSADHHEGTDADRAVLLGVLAAERRLQQLLAEGGVDATTAERLTAWLSERRRIAEGRIADAVADDRGLVGRHVAEGLVQLLDVEREAIRHAARLEVVGRRAAESALTEVDDRMAMLRDALHEGDAPSVVEEILATSGG